jgi:hypothetical protein
MSDPGPTPAAPCIPWELDATCCSCGDEWENYEDGVKERASALAWSTLRALTGGQVGNCPVLMRPCLGPPCSVCNPDGVWMRPFIRDGNWFNAVCGIDPCSCERLCEIVTPGPIAEVLSVVLDGEDIPLDNFRVDNGNHLVRQDGECWPSCQNMNLPLGEPGTLGITYVPGIKPDAAGLWAAGTLACEYAKACNGSKGCRLPSAVTSISRQGVSFNLSSTMFPDGMTGIREVDAYLTALNPAGLRVPPMVWSPDLQATRHRYTTWVGT